MLSTTFDNLNAQLFVLSEGSASVTPTKFPSDLQMLSICSLGEREYDEDEDEHQSDAIANALSLVSMPSSKSYPPCLKVLHIRSADPTYLAEVVSSLPQLESLRIQYTGKCELKIDLTNHYHLQHLQLNFEEPVVFQIQPPKLGSNQLRSLDVSGAGCRPGRSHNLVLNEAFTGVFDFLKRIMIDGFSTVEGRVAEIAPGLEEMYVQCYGSNRLDTGSLSFAKGNSSLLKFCPSKEEIIPGVQNSLETIISLGRGSPFDDDDDDDSWELRSADAWHTALELQMHRSARDLALDKPKLRARNHFELFFPLLEKPESRYRYIHLYAFKKNKKRSFDDNEENCSNKKSA